MPFISDDTDIKAVCGSETSSEKEDGEDSHTSEETISCITDERRDLLKGIPPVQETSEIKGQLHFTDTNTTRFEK